MPKWMSIVLAFACLTAVLVLVGRRDRPVAAPANPSHSPSETATASAEIPAAPSVPVAAAPAALKLHAQEIRLLDGTRFTLNVPRGVTVTPAAEGLGRARFMARSPDGRLFVPDMLNLSDNKRGSVHVLDGFDPTTRRFTRQTKLLSGLRNPNSVAFHTDGSGRQWFYVALTDRLVRYPYTAGDAAPNGQPQTLATFPDYGLSYKHGGWHLTRTIAFGGDGKLYVSVGSSCNACEEKEPIRACVMQMEPDGGNPRVFARGLRNAVGLRSIGGRLIATNMGADHLGNDRPAETLYVVEEGKHYGWPYCYESGGRTLADPKFNPHESKMACADVPRPLATFPARSAPLGLEHFDATAPPVLRGCTLVALHGSGDKSLGRGYRISRVSPNGTVEDFITGFLQNGKPLGRPCDILRWDAKTFFFTDDHTGVLYCVGSE
jgi:glucose/arabinose dehydrogenase